MISFFQCPMCDFKSCEHSTVFHIFTICGLKSCEYGEQRNLMGLGDLWSVEFHTHKTFPLGIIQLKE